MTKQSMKMEINSCLMEHLSKNADLSIQGCDKYGRRILQNSADLNSALVMNMDYVRRISPAEFMIVDPKEYFEDVADILATISSRDVRISNESQKAFFEDLGKTITE